MIAATFNDTNHGDTETRSVRKISRIRGSVPPWLVAGITAAMLLAGCGSDNTPTAPSNPSSTVTENWSSVVAPGGTSTRSFTVNRAGPIVVTLTTAATTLGLGVGLSRTSGGGCRLGVAVNASPGTTPQINTQADEGQYCVQVYDLGTIIDPIGFALKIEHP
jgi:hypothetical protein